MEFAKLLDPMPPAGLHMGVRLDLASPFVIGKLDRPAIAAMISLDQFDVLAWRQLIDGQGLNT